MPILPTPRAHGLLADSSRRDELRQSSIDWPSWTLAGEALTDLDALLGGWLAPCAGYVVPGTAEDWHAAPNLQVSKDLAERAQPGTMLGLRDPEGVLLAALHVAQRRELDDQWWLGGRVEGIDLPAHDEFTALRLTPRAIAERLHELGRPHAAAFLPGALLHAATRHALVALADRMNAAIVVMVPHAAGAGEFDGVARLRAMLVSAQLLPADRFVVAIVPLFQRGQPDVVRAARMAKNCGAAELLVEAGDVSPAALDGAATDAAIVARPVSPSAYDQATGRFVEPAASNERLEMPPAARDILSRPAAAPAWLLTDAEIAAWQRACPQREVQGFTVFLTGLSGSGKSTIARALRSRLLERTGRPVTLLDGDLVRRHLSSELGFSREHRDLNILRIGWVASEIVRHGGIAICAPIAPYDGIRRQVREMIEPVGGFLLVHVATPLETCEARDRKGLYAKARAGLIPNFTGVSDPYEPPSDAALVIDTRNTSVDAACDRILARLTSDGYLGDSGSGRIERRS